MTASESAQATVDIVVMGHLLDDLFDPNNFSGKGMPIAVEQSVIDMAESIGLENKDEYFVVLNDEHLPIDQWASYHLNDGDKLVFCPLLKGG